jgi:hypothetical protein
MIKWMKSGTVPAYVALALSIAAVAAGTGSRLLLPTASLASHTVSAGTVTLPSGHSESGLFANGGGTSTNGWIGVGINYPIPLAKPISDTHVIDVSASSAAHCPGRGKAARGYLCIYELVTDGVGPLTDVYSTDFWKKLSYGILAYWAINGTTSEPYVGGEWTVTAP